MIKRFELIGIKGAKPNLTGDHPAQGLLTFLDNFLLLILAVYLFYLESCLTTLTFHWPALTEHTLLRLTFAIVSVRLGLYLCISSTNRVRDLSVIAVTAVAFLGSYYATKYVALLFIFFFSVGVIGFDYRKLLKCFLIVFTTTFVLAVICCLCGSITNYSYWDYRIGTGMIRSSWGIAYCTDSAAALLFIVMTAYAYFQKWPSIIFAPISLLGALFSWFICNARNSVILFGLCFLFSIGLALYDRYFKRSSIAQKLLKWLFYIAGLFAPLAAVAEVMMTKLYIGTEESGFLAFYNRISTLRLLLQKNALDTYGIKLFGTAFEMVGAGGMGARPDYNFVDCGYMHILVRYGLIPLIVILAGMVFISFKATKNRHYRLAFVIFVIALHSVLEHHMLEMRYNIFLLVPFCLIGQDLIFEEPYALKALPWKKIGPASILPVLCLIFINPIISLLRTFAQFHANSTKFAILIFGILMIVLLFEIGLVKLIDKKRAGIVLVILTGFCIVGGCGAMVVHLNQLTAAHAEDETIVSDADSIQLLKSVEGAKIYAAKYPYFYQKLYGIGENTVLPKEDLARLSNITVIVEREFDSKSFFGKGFVYTPISKHYGIYTDDENVIRVFEDNGYVFTPYLSSLQEVDNAYMAALNTLNLDSDGGILVPKGSCIKSGPSVYITEGAYRLCYQLSMDPKAAEKLNDDTQVAKILITVYDGESAVASAAVHASDFDGAGKAEIFVDFAPGNYDNVEFQLLDVDPCDLKVNGISYQKYSV